MSAKESRTQEETVSLVRILGKDVKGDRKIYAGLTKIKGVSWAISNAICVKLKLDRNLRMSDLKKEDIKRIEEELKNPAIPSFMKNRKNDLSDGEDKHLTGINLELSKEFDVKRMKKIKSYKGMRHAYNLPVRGQRTRSHFRRSGKVVGVKKAKQGKKS